MIRHLSTLLAAALSLAGCTSSVPAAPSPTAGGPASATGQPTPTPDLSTSCTGQPATGEASRYPGWPPDERFELIPIPVSSELAVGSNRVLLNLVDARNSPLASPERTVVMRFYNLATDPATPAVTAEADYLPTTEALPGLYRAYPVDFECWGDWGLEAVATERDGGERVGRMVFSVRPTSSTPAIGAPAPASNTPTGSTPEEIAAISTDEQPDPDFYGSSVEEALAADRPFLLIFSTPAFCATRTCGPALEIVKSAAADFKDEVTFIHVEPYRLRQVADDAQLELDARNQPIVVPAVREWGLPSEPYIFVVDADGRVTAKLEGVASAAEIEAALREVAD